MQSKHEHVKKGIRGFQNLFGALFLSICATASSSEQGQRPNIVLIVADDLGFGDVSSLNSARGRIPTPNIDRLASQGMAFLDAHSASSVCTPTRYGLLTGRYPWRTRLQKGVISGYNEDPLIADTTLTLPEMLQSRGYATAAIGKWHLGFQSDQVPLPYSAEDSDYSRPRSSGLPVGARIIGGPLAHGFDYFWGCSNSRTISSAIQQDIVVEKLAPVEMMPRVTDESIAFIQRQAGSTKEQHPFFLYMALTAPHLPIAPSREWVGRSSIGEYGDFVMQLDASVGRVLAALEESQLSESTLVIFTSDNGCPVRAGVPEMQSAGHYPSGRYRGYKTDIWEGGHRVPFIVRWPGVTAADTVSHEIISLNDVMATIADMLEIPLPVEAAPDSSSFLYALRHLKPLERRAAIVHQSNEGKFAIRDGRWKLIFGAGSGGFGKPTDQEAVAAGLLDAQLYDIYADPEESVNQLVMRPDVARALVTKFMGYIAAGRSTPGPVQINDVTVDFVLPASLASLPVDNDTQK